MWNNHPNAVHIVAPYWEAALHYARKHDIPKPCLHYIYQRDDLLGLSPDTEVLWLSGDARGEFDFTPDYSKMIGSLQELWLMHRIRVRSVRMEEPPN